MKENNYCLPYYQNSFILLSLLANGIPMILNLAKLLINKFYNNLYSIAHQTHLKLIKKHSIGEIEK